MLKRRELDFTKSSQINKHIFQGVEKEGLRVSTENSLSRLNHPIGLGSKLTHPFITTDYSENLLEYITKVYQDTDDLLLALKKMHCFTYHRLEDDEIVWPWSMPAIIPENEMDIKVAHYGSSNTGRLKELYRIGLGHRYGKSMQAIAGVHYNFSLDKSFWEKYKEVTSDKRELQEVINDGYFHLIRNYRRYSWVLSYLFGSTPVVDESFLKNKKHNLEKMGKNTFGKPFATSLRMGGLGYTSNAQNEISICYNKLSTYIETLEKARRHSYPAYEKIGLKDENGYKQLNTNLLQIDNEFYSTIRPKNVAKRDESALLALHRRGIEYIEVRLLDVNPFCDTGIDKDAILFLHLFLMTCLLLESPKIDSEECKRIDENFNLIVNEGRNPHLKLKDDEKDISVQDFLLKIFHELEKTLTLFSKAENYNEYSAALTRQKHKSLDVNYLPSSKILKLISDEKSVTEVIADFGRKYKNEHINIGLSHETQIEWNKYAADSIKDQEKLEEDDTLSFDEFLVSYFEKIKINFKDKNA